MDSQQPVALWKLALGIVAIIVAIDLADTLGGWRTIAVGALTFAGFNYASWRWGRDSRDGADWHPKPKRATPDEDDADGEAVLLPSSTWQ